MAFSFFLLMLKIEEGGTLREKNEWVDLINIFTGSCCHWKNCHHCQTIHSTENSISLILFKNSCIVTWKWLFLTSIPWPVWRAFNNYVDWILPFFGQPCMDTFIPWAWTKTDIFWPPPSGLVYLGSYLMAP